MKARSDESEDSGLLITIVVIYAVVLIFLGGGTYLSRLIHKKDAAQVVSAIAPIESPHSE